MRFDKIIACFLVSLFLLYPLNALAGPMNLDSLLGKLASRRTTSLERLNLVEEYKGQAVKGSGRVKDVLKSFGEENKAMVYLEKSFAGKPYELVLITDAGAAESIKRGKFVRFEGNFAGMTFETLRFESATVTSPKFWFWSF